MITFTCYCFAADETDGAGGPPIEQKSEQFLGGTMYSNGDFFLVNSSTMIHALYYFMIFDLFWDGLAQIIAGHPCFQTVHAYAICMPHAYLPCVWCVHLCRLTKSLGFNMKMVKCKVSFN